MEGVGRSNDSSSTKVSSTCVGLGCRGVGEAGGGGLSAWLFSDGGDGRSDESCARNISSWVGSRVRGRGGEWLTAS